MIVDFALLLLTGIVAVVSILPDVALVAAVYTFGLAIIPMAGALSRFFYLFARVPSFPRGGRKGPFCPPCLWRRLPSPLRR